MDDTVNLPATLLAMADVPPAGLLDWNPAAHAVWWTAGVVVALLVLFLLIDGADALAAKLRRRSAGESDPPMPAGHGRIPDPGVLGRAWSEGRVNPGPEIRRPRIGDR